MTDETFGDAPKVEDEKRQIFLVALPCKPLNFVELAVMEKCDEELSLNDPGIPFFDAETGEIENGADYVRDFGRELTLEEAKYIREVSGAAVMARWRLPLIIARELGPTRRDRGPTLQEFRAHCEAEGVDPII
jgi:hypothetical protein